MWMKKRGEAADESGIKWSRTRRPRTTGKNLRATSRADRWQFQPLVESIEHQFKAI
jgi:hypothetical protein